MGVSWQVAGASFVMVVTVLLALSAPAGLRHATDRSSTGGGPSGRASPTGCSGGVVDSSTVGTTKVMVRVTNRERPASKRNWASVTVFVGGVHPDVGENAWNGHGAWSTIAPGAWTALAADDVRLSKVEGATVVWTSQLSLRSGVWKTRYIPAG